MNTAISQHSFSFAIGQLGRHLLAATTLAWLLAMATHSVQAQETPPQAQAEPEVSTSDQDADDSGLSVEAEIKVESDEADRDDVFRRDRNDHSVIVHSDDTHVAPGEVVDAVVTFGGSSRIEGTVREAVVSIFGDTHVTGPVGDGAVAIFGNTYVNSRVRGDVVAIFGDAELGPLADVGGEVVVVSGKLTRDPAAKVSRGVQQVSLPVDFGRFQWLRPWIEHCLLLGRPLAMEPGLGWAWGLALGFLTLYVLLAALFTRQVEQCVETIESRPGATLVASLLSVILTPVVTMVLLVTVVGVALVPFFWIGLFIAGLFGKAVILAAIGRRLTRFVPTSSALGDYAFAVAVGGLIVLAMYLIPVVGFITYKLIGILGVGVVIYTVMLAGQKKRELAAQAAPVISAEGATVSAAPAAGMAAADTTASAAGATVPPTSPAPAIPDVALPRAGFWIRMGALFVDIILVGIVTGVLNLDGDAFLPLLATYGALMWKLRGTTVGGILCNLKVVRVDGREVDWATAVVRALGCFLSLVVAGLGFIWIAVDPERRGWHDKIAGTAVVRTPSGRSLV